MRADFVQAGRAALRGTAALYCTGSGATREVDGVVAGQERGVLGTIMLDDLTAPTIVVVRRFQLNSPIPLESGPGASDDSVGERPSCSTGSDAAPAPSIASNEWPPSVLAAAVDVLAAALVADFVAFPPNTVEPQGGHDRKFRLETPGPSPHHRSPRN